MGLFDWFRNEKKARLENTNNLCQCMDRFEEIKNRVLELAEHNRDKEVTRKTDYRNAGVYMLYVDCFTDEKIIPFYIGQTDNFQERHKKHLSDLLALNRLEKSCYEHALFKRWYTGRYRPCKIFSYMVNHKCSLNDLHMVILEEIEDESQRLEREAEYIDSLCAPFFGFNQMNCVTKRIDLQFEKCSKTEFESTVAADYENLMQYWQFGYSLFNWYLMHGEFSDRRIKAFLSAVPDRSYASIVQGKKRLSEIEAERFAIWKYINFQAEKEAWEICQSTIKEFFTQHNLQSEEKQKLIVSAYLFEQEGDLQELKKYFSRYKNRIHTSIFDLLNAKHSYELAPIKTKIAVDVNKHRELEEEEKRLSREMFALLLPSIQYQSHPLKSLYDGFSFVRKRKEDNICYLNIEYTCFKDNLEKNIYPEICKIDYLIVRNGKEHARSTFVQNSLMGFFDTDEVYYCETARPSGPFNPALVGNVGTHLAVSMEYKNGINEHTLCGVKGEDAVKVLKEIDSLIDDSTKIIYSTSGYKSTIKSFAEMKAYQNIEVLKRIVKQCR